MKQKLKMFTINYYFNGNGKVNVKAKNEEEARELFFEGNFENEEEWGDQYQIDNIKTIKGLN